MTTFDDLQFRRPALAKSYLVLLDAQPRRPWPCLRRFVTPPKLEDAGPRLLVQARYQAIGAAP